MDEPKSLIIVEDNNDQYTFEAIIRHIGFEEDLSVNPKPNNIDWKAKPKEIDPNKPTALISELNALRNDFSNETYDKVGIIRDMDNSSEADMLLLINNALREAYPDEHQELMSCNTFVPFKFKQNSTGNILKIYFACHFVGVDSEGVKKGEIEDILKAIKSKPSLLADCVDKHLPECLELLGEENLKDKDLVKLWINNYQRYDTLDKKKRTGEFTSWKNVMEKRAEIFDFKSELPEFQELKDFLKDMTKNEDNY
jgi:hypothetical protein